MYLTIYLLVIRVYCRIVEAFANYARSHFAEPLKHIWTKIIEQNLATSSLVQWVKHWGLITRNQLWISPREHYAQAWLAQIDKLIECTFNFTYKHETYFYGNTFRITGPFCEEPRVTGGYPQKGQWCGALMLPVMLVWTHCWAHIQPWTSIHVSPWYN